jgi:hypothetical protein
MALGSTQPLTEISTRRISWGKGGRYVKLTTLPPSCTVVMKSGNIDILEPSGSLEHCNGTALPLTHTADGGGVCMCFAGSLCVRMNLRAHNSELFLPF